MKIKIIIYLSIILSFIYSQCSDYSQLNCNNDGDCEWINDIVYGNCSSMSGMGECDATPGCHYQTLTYTCEGGTYIISDNSYCEEVEVLECTEMYQSQCDQNSGCEWVEDMEWGSCSNLNPYMNNGVSYCNDPSTNTDQCYTYTCYGGYYGQWNTCCGGGDYLIDNNSYCEEVSFIPGDANGDNTLNVADIVLIVDLILNSEYDEYSDINQDGILNVIDVVALVNIILGN